MKTSSLLYIALAGLLASCGDKEPDMKESNAEASRKKESASPTENPAAQAERQRLIQAVTACRTRLRENPMAVFEWDNSIELDKPENEALVQALVETHAREMVRLAVSPGMDYDWSELEKRWDDGWSREREYGWKKYEPLSLKGSEKRINKDYQRFCEFVFRIRAEDMRALDSIMKDKSKIDIIIQRTIERWICRSEKFDIYKDGKLSGAYRCDKVLGELVTLEDLVTSFCKEQDHIQHEISNESKVLFGRMQEKFAPVFDKLMQDIANTSYPAWYVADDVSEYIDLGSIIKFYGCSLQEIKDVLNTDSGSDCLREWLKRTRGVDNLADIEYAIRKYQAVYQERRMLKEYHSRISEMLMKFSSEIPQYLLSEAREEFRKKWDNGLNFLLLNHKEYSSSGKTGEPSDEPSDVLAPADRAKGIGVIGKSRAFQDVYFGMTVQEFFACKGAKALAEKYDVDKLKNRVTSFDLSSVTTLFGYPAKVLFCFRPALAQGKNGEYIIISKLCRIVYSPVTSEEVKNELEQARKKAQKAHGEVVVQSEVAQRAKASGANKIAEQAAVSTLNSLFDILAAQQKAEEARQRQKDVINLWVDGFCSAKKPYRKICGTYTNNPYVKKSSDGYIHDATQEQKDPDLNLMDVLCEDKGYIRLYPARYMNLESRILCAKKILWNMFVEQYKSYKKNKNIKDDTNDF